MKSAFFYKNIFMYSTLQYTGNGEEYFSKHTEKLVSFVVNPRLKNKDNAVRLYKRGKLVKETKIHLSENIFLFYFYWYITHIGILKKYFSKNEKVVVITFHPIALFGMTIQKLFRTVVFAYWIGDYFPPVSFTLRMYELLKRFYNRHVSYAYYLSDIINKKMNGKILNTNNRKTVMWSIIPKNIKRSFDSKYFTMLFVGVIKKNQGLEQIFDFLRLNGQYAIKIIGNCDDRVYMDFNKIIQSNKIEQQVYFPNTFFSDKELELVSKDCQVGVALYNTAKTGSTYYTDPGKVKTYAQFGLPIIMSDIPTVAEYIRQFKCGEIIDDDGKGLGEALLKMKKNYTFYRKGLKRFNTFFYYDTYFKKSFKNLEIIWK